MEAEGLLVLPGLMDLHVHLREPGQEHKETIDTGTEAAAAGGFAIVVAEPNTVAAAGYAGADRRGAGDSPADGRRCRSCRRARITVGQEGQEVTDFAALREAGAVAASDDG